ncbi:helix-turn-helix transcriptional regulator [Plantactinospora mayteni]|uniref:HTH cro/C1-type domain-containing protein n=1 Tax=Plantactinospora mayteni TaxID=566021 RepID=A0ABQ4EIP4_9ACTN|nr:helix-turn-helix domain-containing protein [Plantactinospora mayteni]GIG94617.1 hypothetical protein Pma05_11900 [Plantactinospora mayteni]
MATTTGQQETFADRLNRLFASVVPAGRGPYTEAEVAAALASADDARTISSRYVHMLRTGQRDNPSMKVMDGLARFFGVPPGYFFDDQTALQVTSDLERLAQIKELNEVQQALKDPRVNEIVRAVGCLSPASLELVAGIIDHLIAIERSATGPHRASAPAGVGNSPP